VGAARARASALAYKIRSGHHVLELAGDRGGDKMVHVAQRAALGLAPLVADGERVVGSSAQVAERPPVSERASSE